ncbi:MAG: histidine phosphatase family protein [Candidatus Kaiserbacteria bacterium]|nr:histidine phosphatase family protein [Candidatus Kaiserbacteria bacterium]
MESYESGGKKEVLEQPIFKVTLMRHEEPFYKDIGHDLTEKGILGAIATGKRLKGAGHINDSDEIHLFHSPKARARGTLEFVAEGAGISHGEKRSINQIRSSDIPDLEGFLQRVEELEHDQEAIAKDHHTNDALYESSPDFIEPASKKKQRLYRAFEYLIRSFEKRPPKNSNTPHVFAVSHFEIVTHLIDDVFGIENMGKYNSPAFGEAVTIEAYSTGDSDKVRLKIGFNEHTKEVCFNRKTRSIEEL